MNLRHRLSNVLIAFGAIAILTAIPSIARAQTADTAKPAPGDAPKVTVDPNDPTIMIIESNGERLRVNTVNRSVEKLPADAAEKPAEQTTPATTPAAAV